MNKLMTERTPNPTHEFTLDNGLRVIVREDHSPPPRSESHWFLP